MRSITLLLVGSGLAAFAFVAIADTAEATHYRYGTLQWAPTAVPNEVLFTGAQGWRASAFGSPNVGDIVAGEGSLAPGDGTAIAFYLKVVSTNPINDWFFGRIVDAAGNDGVRHTYPAPNSGGAPWIASWGSCCRISQISSGNYHVNNPDQSEHLETYVDLASPNRSPVTNLPPINPCVIDAICTIPIPVSDADPLTFRLATVNEAGDGGYRPPGPPFATNAATVTASGVITWDTHGATYDENYHSLYSIQVMIQDGRTKTPLDFFIEIVPEAVDPPYWVTPPTPCGTTLTSGANTPVTFDVWAASADPARRVLLAHLGIPDRATFPIPPPANPATSTFSWTPTPQDEGTHLVIFTAIDDRGYATPPCPVTIIVVRGDFNAHGFGASVEVDGAAIERAPSAHVGQGATQVVAVADVGAAKLHAAAFSFDGDAGFLPDGTFAGFAKASTTIGVVEVPGLLRAEGVTVRAESVVDALGAESNTDVRFARLIIGEQAVALDVGGVSGPREFRVPGVATIRLHETIDTGDSVENARATVHAIHVIFDGPVKDLYLVSATAEVGRDVRRDVPTPTLTLRPPFGRCAAEAWKTAPARTPQEPLTIAGDMDILALTGNTGILSDVDIVVPQGGIGISVTGTTIPLTLRNVHLIGSGTGTGIALNAAGPIKILNSRFSDLGTGIEDSSGRLVSVACSTLEGIGNEGIRLWQTSLGQGAIDIETSEISGRPTAAGIHLLGSLAAAPIVVTSNEFHGLASVLTADIAGAWTTGVATFEANLFEGLSGPVLDLPALSNTRIALAGNVADGNAGPLVRAQGGTLSSIVATGNVLSSNLGPAVEILGQQGTLQVALKDNAMIGNKGGLLSIPGSCGTCVLTLISNVVTAATTHVVDVTGVIQGGALVLSDNVALDNARGFLHVVAPSGVSIVLDANRVADHGASAIQVQGGFAGTIAITSNHVTGTRGGSAIEITSLFDTTLEIAGNALDANDVAGIDVSGLRSARANVTANLLTGNGVAGMRVGSGASTANGGGGGVSPRVLGIRLNVFRGNGEGLLFQEYADSLVERNLFSENLGAGIHVFGFASQGLIIRSNDLLDNGGFGIEASGVYVPVDAISNWWGSHEGPLAGDGVSADVLYDPWSLTPVGVDSNTGGDA